MLYRPYISDSMIKSIGKCFLLGLIFMISFIEVKATHIVGGDITYRCLGDDMYEVTLTIRRDCFNGADDADFDDPAVVGIFDPVFGSRLTLYGENGMIFMPLSQEDTLSEVFVSDCGFIGSQVCVQEGTYIDTIRLPFRNRGYMLAYQRCCRNVSLNNIVNPLNTGGTYTVGITESSLNTCNSTPVFKEWGDIYICANEELNFDHSAIDLEGDSLVYRLCTPNQGADMDRPKPLPPPSPPYDQVVWQTGFSLANLMGGVPLEIDPMTGVLTATPNIIGQFLIGVCVDEYRDGVLIGSTVRDFEYNVRACSEAPLANFETNDPLCEELEVSFTNTSLSADQYEWFFDFPNTDPSFMSTTADPNFTFTYPAIGDYTVKLIATRTADGCFDEFVKEVRIVENTIVPDFNSTMQKCNTDGFTIVLEDNSTNNDENLSMWIVDDGISVQTDSGASVSFDIANESFSVTLIAKNDFGCEAQVVRQLEVDDIIPEANFGFTFVGCSTEGNIVDFIASIDQSQFNATSIEWTIDGQALMGNPVRLTTPNTSFEATLTVTFENDCVFETSQQITIPAIADATINASFVECSEGQFVLELMATSSDPALVIADVEWTANTSTAQGNPALVSVDQTLVNISAVVTFENGCETTASTEFEVPFETPDPEVTANFIGCSDDLYQYELMATSTDPALEIVEATWTIGAQVLSGNPTILSTNDFVVTAEIELIYNNECPYSFTTEIILQPEIAPAPDFEVDFLNCESGSSIYQFTAISILPEYTIVSAEWIIDGEAFTGITIDYLARTDEVDVMLTVTYQNGCRVTLTKPVELDTDEIPVPDFQVAFLDCIDGDFRFEFVAVSPDPSINIIGVEWNIDGQIFTGNSIIFQSNNLEVELSLFVLYDTGCTASLTETVTLDPGNIVAPDFEVNFVGCDNEDTLYSFKALSPDPSLTIASATWIINGTQLLGNPVQFGTSEMELIVDLEVIYSDGCRASISETLIPDPIEIPGPDFTAVFSECNEQGSNYTFTAFGTDPLFSVASAEWIIDGVALIGNPVQFETTDLEVNVELTVVYENGCDVNITKTISLTPVDVPEPIISASFNRCEDGKSIFDLLATSSDANVTIVSAEWTINGESFQGNPIEYMTTQSEIEVDLTVTYDTGCGVTITEVLMLEADEIPAPDFSVEYLNCLDGNFIYQFTAVSTSVDHTVVSATWTIGDDIIVGNPINYGTLSTEITVMLTVTYDSGCSATISRMITLEPEQVPEPIISATFDKCNEEGQATFTFLATSPDPNLTIVSANWMINGASLQGNPIEFSTDENEVDVELLVVYDSGCPSLITQTVTLEATGAPTPDFTVSYLDCIDGQFEYQFLAVSPDPSLTIVGTTWEINTTNLVGNPVLFETTETMVSVILTVSYSNGCEASITRDIELEPGDTVLPEINVDFVSCGIAGSIYEFTAESTDPSVTIVNADWTIDGDMFSGNPINYVTPLPMVNVTLTVLYSDGCIATLEQEIMLDDQIPTPEIEIVYVACDDQNMSVFQLTAVSTDPALTIILADWTIDGDIFSGNPIQFRTLVSNVPVTLMVTYQNGCSTMLQTELDLSEFMPEIGFDFDVIGCIGLDSTRIMFSDTTDHRSLIVKDYLWSIFVDGVLVVTNDQASFLADLPCQGEITASLTITYENDCQFTKEIEIPALSAEKPEAGYSATAIDCQDETTIIQLSAVNDPNFNATDWTWMITMGNMTSLFHGEQIEITHVNGSPTIIKLTITYDNACLAEVNDTIEYNGISINLVGNPISICSGQKTRLLLDADPTLSYVWSPEINLDLATNGPHNPIAMPMEDTRYSVTITDGFCERDTFIDVEVLDLLPLVIEGDTAVCDRMVKLYVSGAMPGDGYKWATDPNFNNIISIQDTLMTSLIGAQQTYYVMTDQNAICPSETASVTVIDGSIQVQFASPFGLCRGDTLSIPIVNNGQGEMDTIIWEDHPNIVEIADNGFPTVGIDITKNDDFWIHFTATNEYGCSYSDSILIQILENPELAFNFEIDTCGSLRVCFINASPEMNGVLFWDFGDPSIPVFIGPDPGCIDFPSYGTYEVVLSSISGICQGIPDTQEVVLLPIPELTIPQDTMIVCNDMPVTLTASSTAGNESISWCDSQGNEIGTGPQITIDVVSDSTIIAKTIDVLGCTDTASIEIIAVDDQMMDFDWELDQCGENTICFENLTQGMDGMFMWDFGVVDIDTDTSTMISPCYTYPGPGTYIVTLSNMDNPCGVEPYTEEVVVPVPVSVEIDLASDTIVSCVGMLLTAEAMVIPPGLDIVWCNAEGDTIALGAEISLEVTMDSLLIAKATDSFGCEGRDSLFVDVYDFDFDINGQEEIACENEPITISVTNNSGDEWSYFWTPEECIVSGQGTSELVIQSVEDKTMSVVITDVNTGCIAGDDVPIEIPIDISEISIEAIADPDTTIYAGQSVDLDVIGIDPTGVGFEWDNGVSGQMQTVEPVITTTYTVTVTDENGCTATDDVTVEVREALCTEEDVFIPTAFTPNGDDINDVLIVRSAVVTDMELLIYDRWGEEVYKFSGAYGAHRGWDGRYKNEELTADSYAYRLTATCINQLTFSMTGNVTIIR